MIIAINTLQISVISQNSVGANCSDRSNSFSQLLYKKLSDLNQIMKSTSDFDDSYSINTFDFLSVIYLFRNKVEFKILNINLLIYR